MPICGLCHQNRDLKKSHLMPKSLYKVIRGYSPNSGNDIVFCSEIGSAYTDNQVTKSFLCDYCEGLFSENGEKIVCGECYRGNDKFILRDKVKNTFEMFAKKGKTWINPIVDSKNIDYGAYLYFGASIIWRASAGEWPNYLGKLRGALGNKYQEELRRFLLGETDFPSKIYLLIGINNDKVNSDKDINLNLIMSFPNHFKCPGYHMHFFYIPGIKFIFIVGSDVGNIGKAFKIENTKIFITEFSFKNSMDFQELSSYKYKKRMTPKGRLANDFPHLMKRSMAKS